MSPLGRYPANSLFAPGARLVSRDDLTFTVVEVYPEAEYGFNENHYSELEVLALEEIRFLAALVLSVPGDRGMVYPYFLADHLDVDQLPADDEALFAIARDHACGPSSRSSLRSMGDVLPTVAGGPMYDREMAINAALVADLVSCTPLADHLLLRGLGALIRASMLWSRPELYEAAPMMLYVALEASFQLFRRLLQGQGNPNPSADDAGAYLDQVFNTAFGASTGAYFSDFYEDRIKVLHPASRYGTFAIAPLAADDYHELRRALVDVYGFLVTGRVLTSS